MKILSRMLDLLSNRVAQVGAVILAVLAVWKYEKFKRNQRAIGARKVIEDSKKQGKINEAASAKAHADAAKPGAVERLRSDPKTCRDC